MVIKTAANKEIFESLANFISRNAELLAKPELFNALHQHLINLNEESATLKCLGLITSCKKGIDLAVSCNLIPILSSILLKESNDEDVKTNATLTFKNCMLSETLLMNPLVPWKEIVKRLIQTSYTKNNIYLQQHSIQALRIISDKASIKENLVKVYKRKIRNIPGLSTKSVDLRDDLVDWLNYRNFKSNESSRYSKLFI